MGHISMIRKCVWEHLKRFDIHDDPEWAEHLESRAVEAFWDAIQRVKPQQPGFFPFAYFERWVVGALSREQSKLKHDDIDVDELSEVITRLPDGSAAIVRNDSDANKLDDRHRKLWANLDRVLCKLPAQWRASDLVRARLAGSSWQDISDELSVPIRTCRDRFDRVVRELRQIYGVEPQE